jgi:ubiquinone/menaquinone biosynthesis C-methylase UbiE
VSFDRIAPHYRWLETVSFGNALQRARTFWVQEIPWPHRALICGQGNGRFLCELLRIHPGIEVDCVDASAGMLNLARHRVLCSCPGSLPRVHFVHSDVLKWKPTGTYDLFVTHFFFDCFPRSDVKSIAAKLALAAAPKAVWLVADFVVPASGVVDRLLARVWLRAMYLFFWFAASIAADDLIDPTPYLEANGFIRAARTLSLGGMLKSDLFRAVR